MKQVRGKGLWPQVRDEVEGRDCPKEPSWEGSSGIEAGGKGGLNRGGAGALMEEGSTHQLEKQMEEQAPGMGWRKGR